MSEVGDDTARLVIASPPYTNRPDGRELDKREYLQFLGRVFIEAQRVLVSGGVLVTINTDLRDHARYNDGQRCFEGRQWDKHTDIRRAVESTGLACIEAKVWVKSLKRNLYRYTFSHIQFFAKHGEIRRPRHPDVADGFGPDVWLLEGGTSRRRPDGSWFRDAIHPGIVERCLLQFTSPNDLVVCPFTGSGTVPAMAKMMSRCCVGYEIDGDLLPLIEASIDGPVRDRVYQPFERRYLNRRAARHECDGR